MAQILFGVQYNGVSMSSVIGPLDFARMTEALGFRSFFVPELETLPTLDPFILLSAVAQHTERMRLGTGVAVLPFRSPYQTAKIATSIDVLSGGRMVLGLGSGGVFNDDFGVEGVRPEDRRTLTDEGLELVRRLLSEERVTHSGAHHRMEDMALEPRSVQQPHLPIWTGAMWNGRFSRRMLERTAKWADGFHPHGMTPQGYAEGKAAIEEMAAGLGRDPSQLEWSCNMYLCMGDSREAAMEEVRRSMRERFGDDAWELDPDTLLLGSAADCVESIEAFAEAGVGHFVINALCGPEALLETYEGFAGEVMPKFQ